MNFKEIVKATGIAITGGIASGKSSLCQYLSNRGYLVIDADAISRSLTQVGSPALSQIINCFGEQILSADGSLDRKKMRGIIFSDETAKLKLESIIHPLLEDACWQILKVEGITEEPRVWFYEASLIYERGIQDRFLEVWLVYCSQQMQLQRLMQRDNVSEEDAKKIIANQIPNEKKKQLAQVVLDSSVSKESLFSQADEQLFRFLPSTLSRSN